MPTQKPKALTEEHLEYLDALRESGVVNMFGAVPYLKDEFYLSEAEAQEIVIYWMETFGERYSKKEE